MLFLNSIWLLINIMLIILILVRSPNEQSIQKGIGSLKIFESSTNAEKKIDNFIQFFVLVYFVTGLLFTVKTFF
jgi:preprotein translocase subunit SecG